MKTKLTKTFNKKKYKKMNKDREKIYRRITKMNNLKNKIIINQILLHQVVCFLKELFKRIKINIKYNKKKPIFLMNFYLLLFYEHGLIYIYI